MGHSKYKCNICMQSAPDPSATQRPQPTAPCRLLVRSFLLLPLRKSMQMHFESKHPKEDCPLHALF